MTLRKFTPEDFLHGKEFRFLVRVRERVVAKGVVEKGLPAPFLVAHPLHAAC